MGQPCHGREILSMRVTCPVPLYNRFTTRNVKVKRYALSDSLECKANDLMSGDLNTLVVNGTRIRSRPFLSSLILFFSSSRAGLQRRSSFVFTPCFALLFLSLSLSLSFGLESRSESFAVAYHSPFSRVSVCFPFLHPVLLVSPALVRA